MNNIIKVLVVDDLDLVRTGIRYMLTSVDDINVIGEAKNGKEALSMVKDLLPQVIVLDLKLPDVDAVEPGAARRAVGVIDCGIIALNVGESRHR